MDENPIHELYELGQSVWLDQISRALLDSGELPGLVENAEVTGVTSNPTIFDRAVSGSTDYDEFLAEFLADRPGAEPQELYQALAVRDIRDAADLLRPVYERTDGRDGYVSLEVDPGLAYQTDETIAEARRLWACVDRPNLLIKVPATDEGLPAITALLAEGLNVNVTLMFSRRHYLDVADAYLSGIEKLVEAAGAPSRLASVASFFVSRIDVKVDEMLPEGHPLRGRIGVANTKLAYRLFQETFNSERFAALDERGARRQRFLCASTSTKNPDYSDVLYVEELIGPHTINTMPLKTLEAFRDHGHPHESITADLDRAESDLEALEDAGIDLNTVCEDLQVEGVEKFANSFDALLETLEDKRAALTTAG